MSKEFLDLFGKPSKRSDVCVIGFEPNPGHFARLKELSERYTALGFRTTYIFAAVSSANGTSSFTVSQANTVEGGAHLGALREGEEEEKNALGQFEVLVLDFADFLERHVEARRRPRAAPKATRTFWQWLTMQRPKMRRLKQRGKVLAKIDIEGSEYGLFRYLLGRDQSAARRAVDKYLIEWHEYDQARSQIKEEWNAATDSCFLDDESFRLDPFPLPRRRNAIGGSARKDQWSTLTVKRDGPFWRNEEALRKKSTSLPKQNGTQVEAEKGRGTQSKNNIRRGDVSSEVMLRRAAAAADGNRPSPGGDAS